jgi:hypothetical protein
MGWESAIRSSRLNDVSARATLSILFNSILEQLSGRTVNKGRLGDKLPSGEDYRPHKVEKMAKRLWAE